MIDPSKFSIPVLDHGKVELLDWMGSDLAIVQAAQASFDNSSTTYGDAERGILRFLMRERHGVPFEHVVFKFRMKLPIFLSRQFVKHRISSWSEQSGRYDELECCFYVPTLEDMRTQVGKPGAYKFVTMDPIDARYYQIKLRGHSNQAFSDYQSALNDGVAKEIARLFLPVNFYTTVVWTINARSLLNVLSLRADAHAQREAQQYGEALFELAQQVIPDTLDAWVEFGRPTP